MHCPGDLGKEPPKLAQWGGGVLSIKLEMSKLDTGLGAQVPLLVASGVSVFSSAPSSMLGNQRDLQNLA